MVLEVPHRAQNQHLCYGQLVLFVQFSQQDRNFEGTQDRLPHHLLSCTFLIRLHNSKKHLSYVTLVVCLQSWNGNTGLTRKSAAASEVGALAAGSSGNSRLDELMAQHLADSCKVEAIRQELVGAGRQAGGSTH